MQKKYSLKPSTIFADSIIFFFIISLIYGLTIFGKQWNSSFNPTYDISLSLRDLPLYAFFSALRGLIAYFISLGFTVVIGYWAARSPRAEKIILPFLDIMQSIPVLGFLPGLVLGLISIFPRTNYGLELAAILMIFTGQVWNMTFAFYSSLKSVPTDLKEAASMIQFSIWERFKFLELPYSAMNLTWNSLMSMAGGWFFLMVCEAFTLGDRAYRLPGVGAYMAVAIEKSDNTAILAGIFAMCVVIIFFDFILWRPALEWAHRYRLEDLSDQADSDQTIHEPMIKLIIRGSFVIKVFRFFRYRTAALRKRSFVAGRRQKAQVSKIVFGPRILTKKILLFLLVCLLSVFSVIAFFRLGGLLISVTRMSWLYILRDTLFTLTRVFVALFLGTLWAVPVGIWISQSSKRLRVAQPLIQLMASFPAPMLYPLAISVFLSLHIHFEISSMLLMMLGVQWYILFNVLAGALRIPVELRLAMSLMKSSNWQQWRFLFLPSIFPVLVTGWVTAAGGAWNASIVSEILTYKGQTFEAHGLGAQISKAAEHAHFPELAACLLVMILTVVILNRTVWVKVYALAQTRFRMDL